MFGTLLTWMPERTAKVFLVATANDIEATAAGAAAQRPLRRDLLRRPARCRARAPIFFASTSTSASSIPRSSIWRSSRRAADGFSGAEIEQAIVAAIYEALAVKQPLSTQHVLGEIAHTQPLSVVMAEKVGALRQWAAGRTVKAD